MRIGTGRMEASISPPLFVIPAFAGIRTSALTTPAYAEATRPPGFWIPACAGMTVEGDADRHRADGGKHFPAAHFVIPAPIPSFPRKRESTPGLSLRRG